MARIIALGLAAAVFPLLLACVALLISRPNPRRLLVGFYLGGLAISVASGLWVLSRFKGGDSVLGSDRSSPSPGVSIVAGAVALVLAWLMISARGRSRIEARRARRAAPVEEAKPTWAEAHLDRANVLVAVAVGAAINLPGPFYLLALGDIAQGGYTRGQELGLILLFNVTMFLLLEVPLIGYLIAPEATTRRVAELSRWLRANGTVLLGAIVGFSGLSFVVQGTVAALS